MHPALETFLKEYQIWLKATEEKCEIAQEKFVEIQQKIRDNGATEDLLSELFSISHRLFQTSYLLMESHLRVNNLRANYSEEDQEIIDSYDEVAKKAHNLVTRIKTYRETLENKVEENTI